jgi:hypothetical protein
MPSGAYYTTDVDAIEISPDAIVIDTSSNLDHYEKLAYLYAKDIADDGTILVGITDDLSTVTPIDGDATNWNIALMLYADKVSGNDYKVTAHLYHPSVLIASFVMSVYYGDGSYSSNVTGVNQEPLVNGASHTSIATFYHTYRSAGKYTISMKYGKVYICDYVNPDYTEEATIITNSYDITVS